MCAASMGVRGKLLFSWVFDSSPGYSWIGRRLANCLHQFIGGKPEVEMLLTHSLRLRPQQSTSLRFCDRLNVCAAERADVTNRLPSRPKQTVRCK